MVVGRETRGWNVLKNDEPFTGLNDYTYKAINKHKTFFESQQKKKNARGCTFHNFMRSVAKKSGSNGLIYSNLFCFAHKESIPTKSDHFETIKDISKKLLDVQIKLLSPDIIIFANGLDRDSVMARREYFPIKGDDKACFNSKDYASEGVPNKYLWEFDLYDKIRCLRIQHPSTRSKEAKQAEKFLIDQLLPAL